LLQAIDFGLDIISAPNWVMQVFFLASIVGLPVVLIFAWVFEMTPEGLKRESEIDPGQSITRVTSQKLDRTIITFLAFAVVLLLGERFITQDSAPAPAPTPEIVMEETTVTDETAGNNLRSVAVLPFVNMSSDPEQEYFSDGLSEELLNRLAQNDQLRVAARTSSFQFKGKNQDIADIGRQLKVDHVLEGSVRKAANRLRITAQLIQVDSGYHLWSETYEREIDDVFAIQDDIALAITRALEAELGTDSKTSGNDLTDNLQAYQVYLQARYFLAKRGEANMLKANELFERAVSLDPGFSKAWSGLAYNISLLPSYGATVTANEAWERVKVATEQAIHYDPNNAEAYVALGRINIQNEFSETQKLYEKAYEMAPNDADVANLYADFMMQVGDFPAAERLEQKTLELDPLAAVHYSDITFVMLVQRRYEEGLEYGRVSASLEPGVPDRADPMIAGLIANGYYDEAVREINKFEPSSVSHQFLIDWWWCLLYFQQDDEQGLRVKLDSIIETLGTDVAHMDYTLVAFFTAWLDGTDAALPFLSKAYENNEYSFYWPEYFYLPEQISEDPDWLAFWQQPRLAGLIEMRRANQTQERVGWWKEPPVR
ncbi:MAG: tetratricopeptide repeat protein, partial [Xanthomonadales bacterium]|nr:tetratricopeptide repeat protein [Xanthomonadales bacterium]